MKANYMDKFLLKNLTGPDAYSYYMNYFKFNSLPILKLIILFSDIALAQYIILVYLVVLLMSI